MKRIRNEFFGRLTGQRLCLALQVFVELSGRGAMLEFPRHPQLKTGNTLFSVNFSLINLKVEPNEVYF